MSTTGETSARSLLGSLPEATLGTARAWRCHLLYGILVGLISSFALAPVGSFLLVQVLGAAGGGPVINFELANLALSFRGLLLFSLWTVVVSIVAVVATAGHTHVAAAAAAGRETRPLAVLLRVGADLRRVPGVGAVKLALLAALGLPLFGAVTTALVAFLLLPGEMRRSLLDIVPRGLPVPLWLAGTALALITLAFAWLCVRWSLAIPALALEGVSLAEGMKRSARRTRGNFWHIALAHCTHHVVVALVLSGLVLLLRFVARPVLVNFLEDRPERGAIGLAALLVGFWAISGGLWILAVARLVSLTVVHHVRLGGGTERLEGVAGKRRYLLGPVSILVVGVGAFALATWLTIPHVEAELGRVTNPAVAAHRGSSLAAPENTLASFRRALEEEADWIELDVQQARDGTLVVVHDPTLKRVAGVDSNVGDLDYAALSKLDVGSHHSPAFAGERIPTLAAVIALARGHARLSIEIKTNGRETEAFVPDFVALLRREDFLDHCNVISLEARFLQRVRALEPRIKIGMIITAKVGSPFDLDVDLYSVQPLIATSEFIRRAHAQGRDVHVWTLNEAAELQRFADRGADVLVTDAPDLARRVLDARTPADGLRGAAKRLFGLD
jgi:glycerophosphoryl diester phosphodiesterase